MATISREAVANELRKYGISGDALVLMTGIPQRESSYRSDAYRSDVASNWSRGTGDMGLFQINYTHLPKLQRAGIIRDYRDLRDWRTNVKAAAYLSGNGNMGAINQLWGAGPGGWSGTRGTPSYGVDLNAARAAVSKVTGGNYKPTPYSGIDVNIPGVPRLENLKYTPPKANPKYQKQMRQLLSRYGVKYPKPPRASPALLAFLRGAEMDYQTSVDVQRSAVERIRADATDARSDLERTHQRRLGTTTSDLEGRRMLSSGEANTTYGQLEEDRAATAADVQRRQARSTAQARDTGKTLRTGLRRQMLERVASTQQEQAETEAAARANIQATNRQRQEQNRINEMARRAQEAQIRNLEGLYQTYGAV